MYNKTRSEIFAELDAARLRQVNKEDILLSECPEKWGEKLIEKAKMLKSVATGSTDASDDETYFKALDLAAMAISLIELIPSHHDSENGQDRENTSTYAFEKIFSDLGILGF